MLAQVLVRRGLGEPAAARAFLEAGAHPLVGVGPGLARTAGRVLEHVDRGSRITVHGDYDVDGVCSTAILVRALRTLGADVDWYLPSRIDDGYGLAARRWSGSRRAARAADHGGLRDHRGRGGRAGARPGMDVVVTDHHSPRADGVLPTRRSSTRARGYPCPDLCAAGVAHKLAQALLEGAGETRRWPTRTSTSWRSPRWPTSCRCTGENRRLVRAGLRRSPARASSGCAR